MESHLKTLTYVKTHFTPKVPCLYPLKNDAGVKWVNLRNQCNPKHLRKRDVIRSVCSCLWTEAVTWSIFWKGVLKNFALILKNVGSFKSGILIKKKLRHKCFPVNFSKNFKNTYLVENFWIVPSIWTIHGATRSYMQETTIRKQHCSFIFNIHRTVVICLAVIWSL